MEMTNEQYNRVQEYLDGGMSESQQQQFMNELNSDAALKEYFDLEVQLREDLQNIAEKKQLFSLYSQMEEISADSGTGKAPIENTTTPVINLHPEPEKPAQKLKIFVMKPWVMTAAACIVLALAGIFFLNTPSNNNGNGEEKNKLAGLYDLYFEKDTIPRTNYPLLAKALSDYERNEYTSLQQYDLQHLPNIKGVNDYQKHLVLEYGYYYKGIAYLQTKDFDKANASFQWVVDSAGKQDLQWKAKWYLGLSLIKTGNTKTAVQWLQQLSSDSLAGEYNVKASNLLQRIRETAAEPK